LFSDKEDSMTDRIAAVLLVPTDGDPLGLLAEGPCGARPPIASIWRSSQGNTWIAGGWQRYSEAALKQLRVSPREPDFALVLAWDRKPVAAGLDRLERAAWAALGHAEPTMLGWSDATLPWLRENLPPRGVGALVLLDAEGREVTL